MGTDVTPRKNPTQPGDRAPLRWHRLWNRILLGAALLALVLGVLYGQAFITWLNATLL